MEEHIILILIKTSFLDGDLALPKLDALNLAKKFFFFGTVASTAEACIGLDILSQESRNCNYIGDQVLGFAWCFHCQSVLLVLTVTGLCCLFYQA